MPTGDGWCDIGWLHPDGRPMQTGDWSREQRLALLFSCHATQQDDAPVTEAVAILYNAAAQDTLFTLPPGLPALWNMRFTSSAEAPLPQGEGAWLLQARSMALVTTSEKS
jgi:pullulanase/glycogen debranching enzyme